MNRRIVVRASEVAAAGPGHVLAALGLGSCVVAALYDPEARIAGLAHPLLPAPPAGRVETPGRYASSAIPQLLMAMSEAGAASGRTFARLVGGATMFAGLGEAGAPLGVRNARAVRAALAAAGIPVRGEELGGEQGRSVFLDADDGVLRVTSVGRDERIL